LRRLIGVLVAIAVILGLLSFGDIWVRHRVQTVLAEHIQKELPGSTASVHISSFPFLGRLVVSGTVPELDANVQNVNGTGISFSSISIVVHGLKVDNARLTSREVILQHITSGSVVGDIPQASVDRLVGIPIVLGAGTVQVAGITLTPAVAITDGAIVVNVPHVSPLRIPIPTLSIFPCAQSVAIVPGALRVSCQLTQLPPALADYPIKF
jgi:hypothetical protein